MTFINEYIPEEDIKKYHIKKTDEKFVIGGTQARDWTVDRKRNMYLRNVANGREETRGETEWIFYWQNELLYLQLTLADTTGSPGKAGWIHWKLRRITAFDSHQLPPHLQLKYSDIIADLKRALKGYKDAGVFSVCTDFDFTFDIDLKD